MTEEEWLSAQPALNAMLYHIAVRSSERKLRLFMCACCYRIEHTLIDERSKVALAGLADYSEGNRTPAELQSLNALAREACDEIEAPLYVDGAVHSNTHSNAACAIVCATNLDVYGDRLSDAPSSVAFYSRSVFSGVVYERTSDPEQTDVADNAEGVNQAGVLRDIFGNPFRPVAFDPAWRTDTAVAVARQMYDSREFGAIPILADALQDAGCEDEAILMHCRDANQPHVRGCWVCDLVLSLG